MLLLRAVGVGSVANPQTNDDIHCHSSADDPLVLCSVHVACLSL